MTSISAVNTNNSIFGTSRPHSWRPAPNSILKPFDKTENETPNKILNNFEIKNIFNKKYDEH